MAQFEYFSGLSGYLLDIQADLMDQLNTRIAVPLLPMTEAPKPARRLNPVFSIGGSDFVMGTQYMASVPVSEMTQCAGSLAHEHAAIKAAIDMLFDGF